MSMIRASLRAALLAPAFMASTLLAADTVTIMVFDASGSMWNRMEGDATRIEVARDVMDEYFAGRDASHPISVIAYGHRRRGDCGDIEIVAALDAHDPAELAGRLRSLNPQGMTPLTDSLALARRQIPDTAESADIILVTDGLENCGGDPCALAARLADEGIDIRAHVVGFGMTADEVGSLSCIPEQTGGMLFQTNSGAELAQALSVVSTPEPQPAELGFRAVDARNGALLVPADWEITKVDDQEPGLNRGGENDLNVSLPAGVYQVFAAHPGFEGRMDLMVEEGMTGVIDVPLQKILATVAVSGVDAATGQVVAGVRWTLLSLDTESSETVQAAAEVHRFLIQPGEYRVEGASGALTGAAAVEAVLEEDIVLRVELEEALPEATLEAPGEVPAGAEFLVEWTGPDDGNDYLTIVEAGAPEGTRGGYARTRFGAPAKVTAPDALGAHEVRYVHQASGRTLASQAVTLISVDARLEAPEEVVAGSAIEVVWEGPDNPNDYITVVEAGAPEGTYNDYARTRFGSPAKVTVPDALGRYELRYVLAQSGRTLASRGLTLVPATARLEAPEEVVAGSAMEVVWEGPDNPNDYITVVEAGAPEGTYNDYARTRFGSPAKVTVPDALGRYELRYVLAQSGRTLASRALTLVPATARLEAPEEVVAGSAMEVVWEGPDNPNDYITVVEAGAPEGTYNDYARTRFGSPAKVTVPDALGRYELRYVLAQSGRTLASRGLTLLPATATIEDPGPIVPGGSIEVKWSGPDNARDYITIVEAGAPEGSHADYWYTNRGSPARLKAPEVEGEYELRYVMNQSDRTLASLPVRVGAGEVSLLVEEAVNAGGVVTVRWQGPGRYEDFIQIVEPGSADSAPPLREARASQGSPLQLFAPSAAGSYEIRYRASDSGEVLARIPLTVQD
jgi:Ca-activated chloride channel homolog